MKVLVVITGGRIEILGDKIERFSYQYSYYRFFASIVAVPIEVLPVTTEKSTELNI